MQWLVGCNEENCTDQSVTVTTCDARLVARIITSSRRFPLGQTEFFDDSCHRVWHQGSYADLQQGTCVYLNLWDTVFKHCNTVYLLLRIIPRANSVNKLLFLMETVFSVRQQISFPESLIGMATGWTVGVRYLAGTRNCSLLHSVQTGSGVHPISYAMGTAGCFP
jgi:hypothetical protein